MSKIRKEQLADDVILYQGDCLEVMSTLDDDSIDLVCTDPPYFNVKDDAWDRAWPDQQAFLEWLHQLSIQWARLMKFNASLYCFAGPKMAALVELELAKDHTILNRPVWNKTRGMYQKQHVPSLRKFFDKSERIIFAESNKPQPPMTAETFPYEKIRLWFERHRLAAGLTVKQVCQAMGSTAPSHWFSRSQYSFPAEEKFFKYCELVGADPKHQARLRKQYARLKRQVEDARRVFEATKENQWTDVWDGIAPVNPYGNGRNHPCEKPIELIKNCVHVSARQGSGAMVLDSTMGSGVTGMVAVDYGCGFIGIEQDEAHFERALGRIRSIIEDRSKGVRLGNENKRYRRMSAGRIHGRRAVA